LLAVEAGDKMSELAIAERPEFGEKYSETVSSYDILAVVAVEGHDKGGGGDEGVLDYLQQDLGKTLETPPAAVLVNFLMGDLDVAEICHGLAVRTLTVNSLR